VNKVEKQQAAEKNQGGNPKMNVGKNADGAAALRCGGIHAWVAAIPLKVNERRALWQIEGGFTAGKMRSRAQGRGRSPTRGTCAL
jgi:hypothetical protein